jgi:hypothetical protein
MNRELRHCGPDGVRTAKPGAACSRGRPEVPPPHGCERSVVGPVVAVAIVRTGVSVGWRGGDLLSSVFPGNVRVWLPTDRTARGIVPGARLAVIVFSPCIRIVGPVGCALISHRVLPPDTLVRFTCRLDVHGSR